MEGFVQAGEEAEEENQPKITLADRTKNNKHSKRSGETQPGQNSLGQGFLERETTAKPGGLNYPLTIKETQNQNNDES